MLLKDFYTILEKNNFDSINNFSTIIKFNANHHIFKGHFPENPVVPGVCLMQTIKEILELKFSKKMNLIKGENIKFQSMIIPEESNNIELSFNILDDSNELRIKCKAHTESTIFFTFTGRFQILS